jgi:hypothetical protein
MFTFDDKQFIKDMTNIIGYANGFMNGAEMGRDPLILEIGKSAIESFKQFVDSNARVDPASLQHVYEWYQAGSPDSRLFELDYYAEAGGLTINSTFSQSRSIKNGSNVPFYDKARIMEAGIPVRIEPKKSDVLVFNVDGEEVFTKNGVTVLDPGGRAAEGSYEEAFNTFFNQYFTQSYMQASGITQHLKNPKDFKTNFVSAKTGGKALGTKVGYNWISKGIAS